MTMTVRKFSFAILAACTLFSVFPLPDAQAQGSEGERSGYAPIPGEPFFVLTDKQYGTSDQAMLRVEVSASSGIDVVRQHGGIDVALYRVPDPLAFLKAQKNLHRADVTARPRDEGVANTLTYLWSNAWNKSRRAWRDLFSEGAKSTVTEKAPDLKTVVAQPDYRSPVRFKPLEGFELVERFRYPLMAAKSIDPLEGVKIAGSSSHFIPKNEGNFYVPLGKLRPGLYVAEATLGTYRAVTLVFVSDTVAVTKIAPGSLTVWAAHRVDGRPVLGATLQWTDGRGVLSTASTNASGLATLAHSSPERTYLFGQDASGGVFVSENFYYDSEIYDTKLYTVTDRQLYRPGDEVNIKFLGREYKSSNESVPPRAGKLDIAVLDPNGSPVWSGGEQLTSDTGANAVFRLPDDAVSGGYEIRAQYQGKTYGAAFRVAEYVKPHLEIAIVPDRPNFKTGEDVTGTIRLTYPNGDPVKNAAIDLTLRAQVLTMTQGELRYGGLFPVTLTTTLLNSDDKGEAKFSLPPAKEPSRFVLSALATDGAAYRVRKTSELLVERAEASWKLIGARKFSMPGEALIFRLEPDGPDKATPPAQWEIVRLEDQSKTSGAFNTADREWSPKLDRPGSYSLLLRDAQGRLVAAASHWVGGRDKDAQEIGIIPGTIEMVSDKERYRIGDTAEVLISFSEPVDEALLTLERDQVEASTLLSFAQDQGTDWVETERLTPNQWRARILIDKNYAPNMTFSAVYVKNGEVVFQNAGLAVETQKLALDVKTAQSSVLPGETVTVDIDVSLEGKPAQAMLTVSVVDEMIYALQPEIAPDLTEFFQHLRRNNVRTGTSLNFITYDEAADYAEDAARRPPPRHQYNERAIKVLERARRDDTDTASWQPKLLTDENGHARFTFKMPDALSRWRITVRATALDKATQQGGVYGQRASWIQSDKSLYAKWTSPGWMREGDAPVASLAVFNNTGKPVDAEVTLKLAEQNVAQNASLPPRSIAYLPFKLPSFAGAQTARLEVRAAGELVDALDTPLEAHPVHWRGFTERTLALERGAANLELPADTRKLSLRLAASGSEHFLRIADSLLEYPWGCVEQTSSRLIPLAIATSLFSPDRAQGKIANMRQTLFSQRLRLAALAGPDAVFGWWGDGTNDSALMTAYAYYADWLASRTLGIDLPASHWERVLVVYRDHAEQEPLLHRALSLWFIQQIGLPVRTQTEGLLAALAKLPQEDGGAEYSPILNDPDSPLGLAYARVLVSIIASEAGVATPGAANARPRAPTRSARNTRTRGKSAQVAQAAPASSTHDEALVQARRILKASAQASAKVLLLLGGDRSNDPADILALVTEATPTLDRALALVWTRRALGGGIAPGSTLKPVDEEWQPVETDLGSVEWRWPPGARLPDFLRIIDRAGGNLTAILRFETNEADGFTSALPIAIERKLYRLERREFKKNVASYAAVPVSPAEGLSAQELYLDEIHLTARAIHRYGIVEVPLPPGAAIERSAWGIELIDDKGTSRPIDQANAEEHRDRYGVPVEVLNAGESIVLRHLLRVGQTGRFALPPARYYRMYQPEKKAYAGKDNDVWVVK